MTDEAADRIRLPQKWYIIKIRNNKKKAAWAKQEDKINNPTYYDENGTRIKFDEDYDEEEGGGGEEGGEEGNDDDDDELEGMGDGEYDESVNDDNNGDGDREVEEMFGDDYETKMMEKNEAFLEEKNARILANNKREEDIMLKKQFDKKKGRNVLVRTLSGDFIFYFSRSNFHNNVIFIDQKFLFIFSLSFFCMERLSTIQNTIKCLY